jgi:hypothetical protein
MAKEETEDFLCVWTTDVYGNRILRGLTKEESDEYQTIRERVSRTMREHEEFPWDSVEDMRRDRRRWAQLHDSHEAARMSAISAELEFKRAKPTLN